jgi:hypothetical protein
MFWPVILRRLHQLAGCYMSVMLYGYIDRCILVRLWWYNFAYRSPVLIYLLKLDMKGCLLDGTPFQIIRRFGFSRYIGFAMQLDITLYV